MGMEFGREIWVIVILENGDTLKPRVMEYTLGEMGTNMKENGNNVLNMVLELISSVMGIAMLESIK